jgi:hypothetical protein
MRDTVANGPNDIPYFAKENYPYRMCKALGADLEFWLHPFLMEFMDDKGFVIFPIPIVCVIQDLTGLEKETIRRKLRELAHAGEIERFQDDACKLRVNPRVANRQGKCYDSDLAYEGEDLKYTVDDLEFLTKLQKYRKDTKYAEGQNMNASQEIIDLKRQVKEQAAKINFLEGRLEGQRDVFRAGISTSIDTGMDKVQDILERMETKATEEKKVEVVEPTKISLVKDGQAKSIDARR